MMQPWLSVGCFVQNERTVTTGRAYETTNLITFIIIEAQSYLFSFGCTPGASSISSFPEQHKLWYMSKEERSRPSPKYLARIWPHAERIVTICTLLFSATSAIEK